MKYCSFLILPFIILIVGCSSSFKTFYELPVEFRFPDIKEELIKTYAPYFKDKKFFLDPGHGGKDRNNVGYLGKCC